MDNNERKPGIKWLEKLKRIKHIEIYITIIFVVLLLLLFFSGNSKTKETSRSLSEMTITTYVEDLETNLEEILSKIGGVSNVKVMITLEMDKAYLENSTIKISEFPKIKGVVVTAKGVNETSIKMKVLHAIEAVIDVTNGNIQILCSE